MSTLVAIWSMRLFACGSHPQGDEFRGRQCGFMNFYELLILKTVDNILLKEKNHKQLQLILNNYNLLLSKLWNIVLNPPKPIASTISFLLLHHCTIKTNISFINWISQSVRNNYLLSAASKHSKNKGTYRRDLQATAYIWFHSYS